MTSPARPSDVAELRALYDKSAQGEWTAVRYGNAPLLDGTLVGQSALQPVPRPYNPRWVGYQNEGSATSMHHTTMLTDEDADWIAAAHNSFPAIEADHAALTARVEELERALRPFADIALVRDENPDGLDMIDAPDLAITPKQVRAARALLPKGGRADG